MGLLSALFGRGRTQTKPYVDAGTALIDRLVKSLALPGWSNLLPVYTQDEMGAIDSELAQFQNIANKQLGGEAVFHPDVVPELQRKLAADGLLSYAGSWKCSDQVPSNWKDYASAYLKAWAGSMGPLALAELGDLLVAAGFPTQAQDTFQVILLFPTYARDYFGRAPDDRLVRTIVESAEESLKNLNTK